MNILVYLIHGTFKPGAAWVQNDAAIARSIQSALGQDVDIRKFTWDGLNRFSSRSQASKILCEELDIAAASEKFHRIFIVAHSHGGNIALSAVSNMKHSAKITAMVTLGTPYLRISRKAWAPPSLFAMMLSFWLTIPLAIIIPIGYVFALGVCIFPVLLSIFKRAQKEMQGMSNLEPTLGGAGILPILSIRHGGDEASAWLSILSVTRASEHVLAAFGKRMAENFWGILLDTWILSFSLSAIFLFSISFNLVEFVTIFFLLVIFFLPLLSVIGTLLTSHRFGLGGRPTIKTFFLHSYVTPKPWVGEIHEAKFSGLCGMFRASSIWPLRIVTPHSLGYSDPKAIRKLIAWIKLMCL